MSLLVLSASGVRAQGPENSRPRVFLTDSDSWEVKATIDNATAAVGVPLIEGRGASSQRAELAKTFGERCPAVVVTLKQERADYIVLFDRDEDSLPFLRDNKFVLFNPDGDMIAGGSTRSLGNGVDDLCEAIAADRDGR